MRTLYGLKACDTCRKARQEFEKAGKKVSFVDVRDTPIEAEKMAEFLTVFGELLVNRRSTTWRNLDDTTRGMEPLDLLRAYPTLMKRPVIESDGVLTLGWDGAAQSAHLG